MVHIKIEDLFRRNKIVHNFFWFPELKFSDDNRTSCRMIELALWLGLLSRGIIEGYYRGILSRVIIGGYYRGLLSRGIIEGYLSRVIIVGYYRG